KLHATPVELPAKPEPGPPPGGPDLTPLLLQTSDLNGPATVYGPSYYFDPTALSDLYVSMAPPGQFPEPSQAIEWGPTANQASFTADLEHGWVSGTELQLGSVGDGARGIIANDSHGGWAGVVFSSGQLVEGLQVGDRNAVQASEVQKLAQT